MLLAQDGHAAGDRIQNGLQNSVIHGAILSASCKQKDSLGAAITALKETNSSALLLFDSEFYVSRFLDADKFGKLTSYEYFKPSLPKKDLILPSSIQSIIEQVVDVQTDAGLKALTTPTVRIEAFNSGSEAQAFSFLFGTLECINKKDGDHELYGSLLINEVALSNTAGLAEFLDTVTALRDLKGFYIIIDRSYAGSQFWNNPDTLAALMYITHTLSDNDFEVILGYSEVEGLLSLATGASFIGSGWWLNTSNFTDGRFKSSGGRRRKRYYSYQLMNSIYQDGELTALVDNGFADKVMGVTGHDSELIGDPNNAPWSDGVAILHKWTAIDKRIKETVTSGDEATKLDTLETAIRGASELYKEILASVDIEFDLSNGPKKLDIWLKAIDIYRGGVV